MEASSLWIKAKHHWPIVLLIGVLIVVFYPLWFGKFYATGDMRDVFIPVETFFQKEQLAGRLPAWQPDAAFGFPLIAAAQIGFFYPLLLITRYIPLNTYLPLALVSHWLALACGTYLFARTNNQSKSAAFLSAVSFALGAFIWQHITHLNIWLAVAWLPWQLVAVQYVTKQKKSILFQIGLLGILFGTPFLIGQLQIPALLVGISTVYYIILQKHYGQKTSSILGKILLIGILVAGISAAQTFPTLELIQYSSRGTQGDFDITRANMHSYPLYHLPTLIFPRFYGSDSSYWGKQLEIEYGFFIGTIPLLLAVGALRQSFKKSTSPTIKFLSYATVVSFLLALGGLSPFRLLGIEPSLWVFSAPARWLLFSSFGLSMLAGYGFDQLENKSLRTWRKLAVILWLASITVTAALLVPGVKTYLIHTGNTPYYQEKVGQMIDSAYRSSISLSSPYTWLPLLMLGVVLIVKPSIRKPIILAVTVIELIIIATTTSPTLDWSTILTPPSSIKALPAAVLSKQARVLSLTGTGDTGALFTNPATRANQNIRHQQRELLVPLISSQFNISGVSWPASLDIQSVTEAISAIRQENNPYQIKDEKEVAALNIGAVTIPTGDTEIMILPIKHQPRALLRNQSTQQEQPLEYQSANPSQIEFTIEAKDPSQLIIRDTWYPTWQAFIDGVRTPIEREQTVFRRVDIPIGKHTVLMQYKSSLLTTAIIMTSMTILACCAMLVVRKKL